MHHKCRRPKSRRAGCLLCKPQKANHATHADRAPAGARKVLQEIVRELAAG